MQSVVIVVGIIWILATVATWLDARHELDELLDAHLEQAATLLLIQKLGDFDEDDIALKPPNSDKYGKLVMFQIIQSGKLVLKSDQAPDYPLLTPNMPRGTHIALQFNGQSWRAFKEIDRSRSLDIIVAELEDSRRDILWAVLRSSLWPLILCLPILYVAIWLVVRRSIAPIQALSRTVVGRDPQSLEPISQPQLTHELQPLVLSMNSLFKRVGSLLESERRFTADAAHELRTPIAAIRMQAQVAQAANDPTTRQNALTATILGCDRATRLVEQLLTLARIEANEQIVGQQVNLNEIIILVISELAISSARKQQSVIFESAQICLINGNDVLLRVLIRNLIDNAIRYSPTSSTIVVKLNLQHELFQLVIEDSGNGMSDEDIKRLGQRFFRVTGSDVDGSGLGWSIVSRIVTLHALSIETHRSNSLGGLAVSITGNYVSKFN